MNYNYFLNKIGLSILLLFQVVFVWTSNIEASPPPSFDEVMCSISTPVVTDVSCYGESTGRIFFIVSGDDHPYDGVVMQGSDSYPFTSESPTDEITINSLPAGDYIINIPGLGTGCNNSATIEQPDEALSIDTGQSDIDDISCNGENDGSINIDIDGGYWPYVFNWSPSSILDTIQEITDLEAGVYSFTVTDDEGCTLVSPEYTITEPPAITATISTTNITCNGDDNGILSVVNPGGGQGGPYTFVWSNNDTSQTIDELEGGTYTVTIEDAQECTLVIDNIEITEPDELTTNEDVQQNLCFGDSNGSILLTPSGGTPGYNFNWDGGSSNADLSDLQEGDYSYTISDANNCSITNTIEITQPDELTTTENVQQNPCFGDSNGSITLTPNGGTGDYSFTWDDESSNADLSDLQEGDYSYTISDANDCSITNTVLITQPDILIANANLISNVSCLSNSDGSVNANPSGGTGTISAMWDNGSNDLTLVDLSSGIYTVTITDDNGCTAEDMVQVDAGSIPSITSYETEVTYSDGEATNLVYMADQNMVSFDWEVVNNLNIDTLASDYMGSGLATSSINSTFHLLSDRSTGWVIIEITPQSGGCVGTTVTTRVNISPEKGTLFIPDLITPNQDGSNDFWDVIFSEDAVASEYSVKVFNRSGGIVFEANSFTQNFNGDGCPDGVYYYIINRTNSDEVHKGAITILRN